MSDETPTPTPGKRTQAAISAAEGAIGPERRLRSIEAMLEQLTDEQALEFQRQESRAKKAEACTRIGENLTHPSALKYYAGIVVLVIGSYAGLSFSGYGVSVGAPDCGAPVAPTEGASAMP